MDVEPHDIPDYTEIEDHKEAKIVMKEALENIIEEAGENAPNAVAEAKEVLESDLFIEQKGIRSLTDKDARVGNKSKTKQFFGYKAEIAMTNSGIITAVTVNPGNYVDGTDFEKIYKQTEASGLNVTEFYGDKAYYEHNQWSKTEEFKEGYKKRAKIEPKNAEIKRFNGLDRARGDGLKSVSTQTKLTIIATARKMLCK